MTCPRTAAHEETELLTVLKIPFRRRVAQIRVEMRSVGSYISDSL